LPACWNIIDIVQRGGGSSTHVHTEKPQRQQLSKGEIEVSVLDSITKKVTDTAKAAAKISGSVVEITKLNMSINTEEEKVKKLYMEIGKQLYEDYIDGKPVGEELMRKCIKIDEIITNIAEMKEKILELKNVKACPNCGTILAIDMEYCHKCGKKQEEQPAEAEEVKDVQD
jgi:ribosomal protein S27AE